MFDVRMMRRSRLAAVPMAVALTAAALAAAQAAPLLPTLAPAMPQAAAAVPAPGGGVWNLRINNAPAITPFALSNRPQDNLTLNSSSLEAALLLDPAEEGREAITQSLQESDLIHRMLGSALAITQPGDQPLDGSAAPASDPGLAAPDSNFADDAGTAPVAASPSGTATPAAAPRAAQQHQDPTAMDDVTLIQDEGPTLRTVARSLVSIERPDAHQPSRNVTQSVVTAANDVSGQSFSLSERLLDSRMLGDVLQAVVRPTATYSLDNSFSIFGQGRFELALDFSSGGSANVNLSESASGASVSMSLDNPPSMGDGESAPAHADPKIDIVAQILDFLASSTGMFISIMTAALLIVGVMVRLALTMRR